MTASDYIAVFGMESHPEGGHYVQTYQATELIPHAVLPKRFCGDRPYSTAIYFLLENHQRSALHRIQSDEVWHFYAGGPLNVYMIDPESGTLSTIRLGTNPNRGEVFQAVVPAGYWFGAKPVGLPSDLPFALVGCTVAPAFDFAEFELGDKASMLALFPQHVGVIDMLT
ncbi:cupin domain-containing protein [Fibrella forsythiae]|uniref:Cupin domain-containing protein n=1 Tax=Fibrella forsythiae TaxID=2817061 RepID=A0ABS3JDV7_9BACT|nr:cupin domain-containing protein [Fibrella forsythiae]MBO0948176.1 cupin domain-containing protein [Fibrella forsythiae]